MFRFMCSDDCCNAIDIPDISKAYKHVAETGHEVYQYVMIGGKAELKAMITPELLKSGPQKPSQE